MLIFHLLEPKNTKTGRHEFEPKGLLFHSHYTQWFPPRSLVLLICQCSHPMIVHHYANKSTFPSNDQNSLAQSLLPQRRGRDISALEIRIQAHEHVCQSGRHQPALHLLL